MTFQGGNMQPEIRLTPSCDDMTAIKLSQLEMKRDIHELHKEVKEDIGALRQEVKQDFEALRQEVKQDIGALRLEVKQDIGALRQEVKQDIRALHQGINDEMSLFRQDMYRLQQHARTDFRLLFGALISLAIGMSGLVAKAFNWI
ncbi:hypothetical protein [Erwinia amylovora]|uniref:hypothetical protein n=1 Tax=Erwinia amylovora TaxID=552 RepID=UPI00194E1246